MRSGLAIILGLGAGLALSKRPSAINCLWLGILTSFAYLFINIFPRQSPPIAYLQLITNIIYRLKISGVLMGIILIVGLLATILDTIRRAKWKELLLVGLLWLSGSLAVLYSFVFTFDTRNGVGLAVIMFAIVLSMVI